MCKPNYLLKTQIESRRKTRKKETTKGKTKTLHRRESTLSDVGV